MLGLYDRDYLTLNEDEIEEKNKIDESVVIPNTPFKKNCYREYSKAVRHNLMLFPNNYIDNTDLVDNEAFLFMICGNFYNLIKDTNTTELKIKRFIQDNKYYHIPASLLNNYYFGHHGAYVFKEFKIGTSYVADYVLVGDSSDGHQFVFVECENPYKNITNQDGSFGETIRKGINQINDWDAYIMSNFSAITSEFKKYTSKQLPDEFYSYDNTRINYMVIAGRRSDFNDKTRILRRKLEKENSIKLMHYDNWCDISVSAIGRDTY